MLAASGSRLRPLLSCPGTAPSPLLYLVSARHTSPERMTLCCRRQVHRAVLLRWDVRPCPLTTNARLAYSFPSTFQCQCRRCGFERTGASCLGRAEESQFRLLLFLVRAASVLPFRRRRRTSRRKASSPSSCGMGCLCRVRSRHWLFCLQMISSRTESLLSPYLEAFLCQWRATRPTCFPLGAARRLLLLLQADSVVLGSVDLLLAQLVEVAILLHH